jgi:hypothetical protein
MNGNDWGILVLVIPLIVGGLLGVFFAGPYARFNAAFLRFLRIPQSFIELTCDSKLTRAAGIAALFVGLGLLLVRLLS